jgi:hypothetical protein
MADKINGIRFISSKKINSYLYRVEIWVSFDEEDTVSLQQYKITLKKLFDELKYEERISFKKLGSENKPKKE